MSDTLTIFAAGTAGVFCAMALLYLAVKTISAIAVRFDRGDPKK